MASLVRDVVPATGTGRVLSLVDDLLRDWTEAVLPSLSGAEQIWHRQEARRRRTQIKDALERVSFEAEERAEERAEFEAHHKALRGEE